jgi:mono/diheme cytochrome c family protein
LSDPSTQPRPPEPPPQIERNEDAPPERYDVSNLHAPIMREKLEPRDGFEPVPIWLVAIFGAFLFWGGWYLSTYSGGFRADVLEAQPEARFIQPVPVDRPVDPMVIGARMYRQWCAACHQPDGQGVPGQYPPLLGSEWVVGEPARLKRIVLHGYGLMPAFGDRLDDMQMASVLTYIRNNWGNVAPAITEESVAATRRATEDRVRPWTADELLQITEDDFVPGAPGVAVEVEMPDTPPAEEAP